MEKSIYIITGHYGCGKTNLSVNIAMLYAKKGIKTAIVDADTVNPYFRTADFKKLFTENSISFYGTMYANTNLDIPAVNFDIDAIIKSHDCIIIDVGGDDSGAVILGRYKNILKIYYDQIKLLFVINKYRDINDNKYRYLILMEKIEHIVGMKLTGIVNNSNTGTLTSTEDIISSVEFIKELSILSNVPIYCHTADSALKCDKLDSFVRYIKIYVKNIF